MAVTPPPSTIGQSIPRVEGPPKVAGEARYTADVSLPGLLWASLVHSPVPHARILAIDTSAALRVPGVRAVLTARDLPDQSKRLGRGRLKDLPLLCSDRMRFVGDKVAMVAAEDRETAEEAAALVRIEYAELPAVFDPLAAMEPGAPAIHPDARSYRGFLADIPTDLVNVCGYEVVERGNAAAGFAQADVVLENTFGSQLMHQGYLEPHAFMVAISEETGRIEVWASNKTPYNLRREMAGALDRPESDILVHAVSIGADFGGKSGGSETALLYHVARICGRPVKLVLSSSEDLTAASPRHPCVVTIRSGVRRDGTIVARWAKVVFNSGAYGAYKPSQNAMLGGSVGNAIGSYDIPNARVEGFMVYTNQVPGGYMRAPGQPQVFFAVEAHMDLLAKELGMDPLELRMRNITRRAHAGVAMAPVVLQRAAEAVGYGREKSQPSVAGRLVGRGVGIADRGTGTGEGSSDVTVNPDGSVTVVSAMPDNGPGGLTLVVQIVAETFGIPIERVQLVHGDTDSLPVDIGSGASRGTYVAGTVAQAACNQVIEQLTPLATTMLGGAEATWVRGGWTGPEGQFLPLEDLAAEMIKPNDPAAHALVTMDLPRAGGLGFCAQGAEVEVDTETGQVFVKRISTAQDVGTVLNALGHQGQVDSQVVQGMGYALSEELVVDGGQVVSSHLGDYKLPTARDIPEVVTANVESTGVGPHNARAVGELLLVPTAAAIANAVADAIGAPVFELPITAERVLAALEARNP